ncbi:MAG: hypothetical protein SFW09_10510 [Hyphomicrobiaceae bacterium]|nr:hypothetical protein [Hyphomicrobiaceae bacterium]
MRLRTLVATIAFAALPVAAVAAPMSTSDLLKPKSAVEEARCYRYCVHHGYCGYGYKKYRCCKHWKTRCSYGYGRRYH